MAESGKKVEVRFGAFSCSIEGYDNPVEQMREVLLLMQGMIRETPALADHGPGFGEDEVARIEHALDRRAERQADGPGIVVIRGPEATRNGDDEAEDAVTTAEIPPGTRRLADAAPETAPEAATESATEPAEDTDDAGPGRTDGPPPVAAGEAEEAERTAPGATPGIFAAPVAEDPAHGRADDDQLGDDQGGNDQAGAERDDGEPEHPLDDETGAAPAAAAIFSAPAAAMAEAAFSADLAGTDEPEFVSEPEPDARTGPGGEAEDADADRASLAEAGPPAETGQPDDAEHPDAPPAPGARAEEANRLWEAAVPDPREAPAGDRRPDTAGADDADAAPAEQPNHLWDAADAAPPDFDEGPWAETAPVDAPEHREALDETSQPAEAPRTDEPVADAGQRDPFARDEAAELPDGPQVSESDKTAHAGAGEHEWEVPGDLRAGDSDEQAYGGRASGSEPPAPEPDRSRDDAGEEPSADASDRDLQAAAEAALAAHGFGPGTAEGGDRQHRRAGRRPDFAPPSFAPERQHAPAAEHRLNIFAPPPPSPAGRAAPAAAAINIFAPPPDGRAAAAAAVNIFAPPPGTRSRDAAPRQVGRTGRLFARTAAGPARQPASDAWMPAAAPDDEDDPAPRRNGAHRAGRAGNGPHSTDRAHGTGAAGMTGAGEAPGRRATAASGRHDIGRPDEPVNIFAEPRAATPQPPTPPPALRSEPGPAAAAWDSPADEADRDDEPQPADKALERPGTGWPGAGRDHGPGDGGEDVGGRVGGGPDAGSGGATDWNDGLRQPPRPARARPNEERSRFSALLARLGGRRTAEPEREPTQTTPDAHSTPARDDGGDAGPADLAERAGATSVADLLAVAAAWLTLVEGKPRFTRREVMETFERLPGNHPRTLEARIKGFGKLVRSSTLILVDDGVFAMSQAERDRYQAMIDDG